ncbi:MAG: hypothetical protein EAZ30_10295 [Betaproteobacteria bacterium]|nr:MAG: hypothetical protein EAZ30_10295 [Betaproteobacteria bacterium]
MQQHTSRTLASHCIRSDLAALLRCAHRFPHRFARLPGRSVLTHVRKHTSRTLASHCIRSDLAALLRCASLAVFGWALAAESS